MALHVYLFTVAWRLPPGAHAAWLRWLAPALPLPWTDAAAVAVAVLTDPQAALPRSGDRTHLQRLQLWPRLAAAAVLLPVLPEVDTHDVAAVAQTGTPAIACTNARQPLPCSLF